MAGEIKYGIKMLYDGSAATRGLDALARKVTRFTGGLRKGIGLAAGLASKAASATAGFAGMGGRGRPGGAGGMFAGLVQGATSLALAPVRILAGFAKLIPGIGGILGGVVSTGANILQGLVGIAANVVGGILNALGKLVAGVAKIFARVVGAAGRALGKIGKIAGVIGLAAGATLAYMIYKGIKRNFTERQLRAIFKARMGKAWQAAWAEVLKVRQFGGFEVSELADALIRLQRGGFKHPQRFLETMVDTAHGAKASLQEVADILLRMKAGGGGGRVATMLQRLGFTKAATDRIKTAAHLLAALQKRYGGIARQIDKLDPLANIWRNVRDAQRDLTEDLAKRLTPRLNRLVDLMDRFRASAKFKEWKKTIGEVGDAIAARIEAGIERVWNYLTTRDWGKAWQGVLSFPARMWKEVVPDIGRLFVDKSGSGWMGPITATIVAAFEWVAAKLNEIFMVLWEDVGKSFRRAMVRNVIHVVGALTKTIGALVDPDFQEAGKLWDKYMAGREGRTWAESTPQQQREYAESKYPAGATAIAQAAALQPMADALNAFAAGLATERTGEQYKKDLKDAAQAQAQAADKLIDAAAALRSAVGGEGGVIEKAGRQARETLPPPQSDEQIAAKRQAAQPSIRRMTEFLETKKRRAAIVRKRRMAGFARAANYLAAAVRMEAEAASMEAMLDDYLATTEQAIGALAEGHARMARALEGNTRRLKRLATARAR